MEAVKDEAQQAAQAPNLLMVTKDRVKGWSACADGYRWFLEKFPQGGEFAEVYAALQADKRYEDSGWLLDHVFGELDAAEKVRQTVKVSGADSDKIAAAAAAGAEAATTGEGANAATTGYRANAATTGEGAIAAALGISARAMAGDGGAIMLAGRDEIGRLLHVFASKVGDNGIKAGVWYGLDSNGNPVEVQ